LGLLGVLELYLCGYHRRTKLLFFCWGKQSFAYLKISTRNVFKSFDKYLTFKLDINLTNLLLSIRVDGEHA
jgi:hypothetical protein